MDAPLEVAGDFPQSGGGLGAGGAHQAASVSRRLRSWRPTQSGPNTIVAASAPELIRRSRDLRRNNPHGKGAADLLTSHIVGMGIKPRPQCKDPATREALTALFDQWSRECDADGLLDFYGLQALAVSEMVEAGEIFARLRPRFLSDGLSVPLQVQLIPAEQVPLQATQQYNGGNPIQWGIERNPIGQRVAYWIYPLNPYDMQLVGVGKMPDLFMPGRVDSADVAHLFLPSRIGQMRGLPWLAAAMTTLQQINQYMDAELLRKQMVAAIVGFVKKSTSGDVTPAQLEATFGQIQEVLGSDIPAVSQEPGTMQYLDPGEDVTFNNPADVGANFAAFVAANYRAVAIATGVLYEELTGDWSGANDRTFRAQFNTFKRRCRQWQYNLVCAQFCQPVWERFVELAVASGAIKQPRSVTDQDLKSVAWNTDRWEYIQPVQDIDATGLEIGLGLTSRSAAVAERGDDVETIDQQIADDRKREQALGLAFGAGLAKASISPNLTNVDQAGAATPTSTGQQQQSN